MIIKRDVIYSPNGEPRTLHIYLPDSYDTATNRYPVTYFFDGHNLYYNEDAGNHISILTHPGDKGPFDIQDIARACQDTGTHNHIRFPRVR